MEDSNQDPLLAPAVSSPASADPKVDKKKPSENVSLADNSLLVSLFCFSDYPKTSQFEILLSTGCGPNKLAYFS